MAGLQVEDDLGDMSFLDKKKLSGKRKGIFTRHVRSCELQLELWRKDPEGRIYEKRAKELLEKVRSDHEISMQVYDAIQNDTISEKDFTDNFTPKMDEMDAKMKELEEAMAQSTLNSRETLRDRERATRDTLCDH